MSSQLAASSTAPANQSTDRSTSRLAGIDGLRAVAAIWVVLFHMWAFSGGSLWPGFDFVARSGSTGVSLFLVLSGLCLYLPYAGGRHDRFNSRDFFRRRVRRFFRRTTSPLRWCSSYTSSPTAGSASRH